MVNEFKIIPRLAYEREIEDLKDHFAASLEAAGSPEIDPASCIEDAVAIVLPQFQCWEYAGRLMVVIWGKDTGHAAVATYGWDEDGFFEIHRNGKTRDPKKEDPEKDCDECKYAYCQFGHCPREKGE